VEVAIGRMNSCRSARARSWRARSRAGFRILRPVRISAARPAGAHLHDDTRLLELRQDRVVMREDVAHGEGELFGQEVERGAPAGGRSPWRTTMRPREASCCIASRIAGRPTP
jgi:hypothetical protein